VVPLDGDVAAAGLGDELVGQDLLGTELVAPVNEGNVAGDVGEVEGFLHGGVAAANDRHGLSPVEEAVAGGTGRDPFPLEGLFGGEPQIPGRGAGGDDKRIAGVYAAVPLQAEGSLAKVGLVDVVRDHGGIEPLGMLAHPLHELGPLDAARVAGPVVHLGGGHELPPLLEAGDESWAQVCPGGVDGGGVAGGAGAENNEPVMGRFHIRNLQKRSGYDNSNNVEMQGGSGSFRLTGRRGICYSEALPERGERSRPCMPKRT